MAGVLHVSIKRVRHEKHHPDHNPNDIHAAERFVQISEAYAILGNPTKREKYDRETQVVISRRWPNASGGSFSSSAPHGARPASGLSKRRTTFRGPPPSFYRNGGWGQHGARRQQQADATASAHASATSKSASGKASVGGGLGPAGAAGGLDNDVPHFDRRGHFRTQEQQDQRRARRINEDFIHDSNSSSLLLNFFLVSGILAVTVIIPTVFARRRPAPDESDQS
ncbi:MAG: hypothetical protein Q9219_005814 [cf. Caloplaca sp. 3 TL-2023]